jgi:RHS repeat-associated protein
MDSPAAAAFVCQHLHDGRGSMGQLANARAELVKAATKDAAAVLKLDYSAYGTAVNYAAESVAMALLHNGEFVDPVTGQQYLRARWYDQASGRFNRVDPFAGEASVPQSLHKYLFARGDPATGSDPKGEAVHWVITTLLAGAVLGVTFAVAENIAGGTLQQQWSAGLAGLGAGLAIGASIGAPGQSASKVLLFAAINGLAFALAYIAAEQVIKQSQASAAEIVLQFANGVSDGAISEMVDQLNVFGEGTRRQQLLQTLYAPLYNAFSSISASLLAREPVDWNKLQTRFMVDIISAYFSQSEFSKTWFTKAGSLYSGVEERVVVEALAAFFKNPEHVSTALSSFGAALVGQFI